MLIVTEPAREKLKQEFLRKCYDAGVGFRIKAAKDEGDKLRATLNFDRQKVGDVIQDLNGVKILYDVPTAQKLKGYRLSYFFGDNGGFFLIKRMLTIESP
jgi:Fe-S cluster assembly iron-binding protein IscA